MPRKNKPKRIYFQDLTETEKAILMGSLLGDATLQKRGNSYRIRLAHSIDQRDYMLWLYNKLKRLTTSELKDDPTNPFSSFKDNNGNQTDYFYLTSGPYLETLHKLFYQPVAKDTLASSERYVKTITQETVDSFIKNPLLLAVWYMDDGTARNDSYAAKFCTQGFTLPEQKILARYLEREWGLSVSVQKFLEVKDQYDLQLLAPTFGKFVELVQPFLMEVPSMRKKLNEEKRAGSKYLKNNPNNPLAFINIYTFITAILQFLKNLMH